MQPGAAKNLFSFSTGRHETPRLQTAPELKSSISGTVDAHTISLSRVYHEQQTSYIPSAAGGGFCAFGARDDCIKLKCLGTRKSEFALEC
mmetsp:Transcript_32144/g.58139  ORF Transcript_32144/g.58139 Transcript_32144/m.58139 type:complete len:90 (+) Transcript_32144:323-592(+)